MKKELLFLGACCTALIFFKSEEAVAFMDEKITSNQDNFNKFNQFFKTCANKYGIKDWLILKAIAWNESSVGNAKSVKRGLENPDDIEGSKSFDGKSWGIMQVTLPTANDMRPNTTAKDLNDPYISIELGSRYLAQMLKMFSGDLKKAVMSYNQGAGNTKKGATYALGYYEKFLNHYEKLKEMENS